MVLSEKLTLENHFLIEKVFQLLYVINLVNFKSCK
jgi:hypothetical protein